MKLPPLAGLESLTELGTRSGIDVRPTLLRVLTDLYVQKPTHTADEDRQYTELALRLMEAVDVATRATVAAKLTAHPAPPASVLTRLKHSLPEEWRQADDILEFVVPRAIANDTATRPIDADYHVDAPPTVSGQPDPLSEQTTLTVETAAELNDIFFNANAEERRLILINLDVLGLPTERRVARDPHTCERLEAAAFARNNRHFIQHLAKALHLTLEQANRMVRDESGETIVVAAKALLMPTEMLQRILLFINPAVGRSVERALELAELYDQITLHMADHMLTVWQALGPAERSRGAHQPSLWNQQAATNVRMPAATGNAPGTVRMVDERRNAS